MNAASGESLDRRWGPRSPGACALRSRSEKLREHLFLAHFCVSVFACLFPPAPLRVPYSRSYVSGDGG